MGEPVRCHKLFKGKFKVVLHFHRQIKNIEMKLQIGFFVKKKKGSKFNSIPPDTIHLHFYRKNNLHYYRFQATYCVVKMLKDDGWHR